MVIPSINVDVNVVEGDDWEQLKKGVAQHIGTADPGQAGNMVLSAHNDIFGELFRYLPDVDLVVGNREKAGLLADLPIQWHMIGHLQRNKIKRTLPLVALLHSGDSPELIVALDRQAAMDDLLVDGVGEQAGEFLQSALGHGA